MLTHDQLIEFHYFGNIQIDNYLNSIELSEIKHKIESIVEQGDISVVDQDNLLRTQKFYTKLGSEISKEIPKVNELYTKKIKGLIDQLFGPQFAPLNNKDIGLSLNITPKSGLLSYHYDRNEITAILYIQGCDGGDLELYPRFRILLPNRYHPFVLQFQRILDIFFRLPFILKFRSKQRFLIKPKSGLLVIMQGSRCLHRVLPVVGEKSRIAFVFCYDKPTVVWTRENAKDYYGFNAHKLKDKK